MLRISDIKLGTDDTESDLRKKVLKLLGVKNVKSFEISKKSIDARKKPDIHYVYSVDVETDNEEYYAKKMMKLTYVINGICCLVVILTMPVTLRLYGVSGETRHLGAVLALIHNGCAIFLWPAGFCLPNVMRAANDVKFPMCVSIASMFIFRIGLSYVTGVAMGLGAIGVWIAMIIDWIVRISFFVTRFFSGKWKTFYHGE